MKNWKFLAAFFLGIFLAFNLHASADSPAGGGDSGQWMPQNAVLVTVSAATSTQQCGFFPGQQIRFSCGVLVAYAAGTATSAVATVNSNQLQVGVVENRRFSRTQDGVGSRCIAFFSTPGGSCWVAVNNDN